MTTDEILFFNEWPQLVDLYVQLRCAILDRWPETEIKVSGTQISFYERRMFAMASLPLRRKKDWPKEFLMVSFGLAYPLESARIAAKAEAYRNHWTHHVLVEQAAQIDGELLGWMEEARNLALAKR